MAEITLQDKWEYQVNWLKENATTCPECGEKLYLNFDINYWKRSNKEGMIWEPYVMIYCGHECEECDGLGTITCDCCNHDYECDYCSEGFVEGCDYSIKGVVSEVVKEFYEND